MCVRAVEMCRICGVFQFWGTVTVRMLQHIDSRQLTRWCWPPCFCHDVGQAAGSLCPLLVLCLGFLEAMMIMGSLLSQEVIILQCQPPKQLCNKGPIKTKQGALGLHSSWTRQALNTQHPLTCPGRFIGPSVHQGCIRRCGCYCLGSMDGIHMLCWWP